MKKNKNKYLSRRHNGRRIFSMILVITMLLGLLPSNFSVEAANEESASSDQKLWEKAIAKGYYTFNFSNEDSSNPDPSGGHVQGICVDDEMEYMYYGSSCALFKMDMATGEVVGSVQLGTLGYDQEGGVHLGCLDYYDGWVFGSLLCEKPAAKIYLVAFDTTKITETGMDGFAMGDGIKAVLLEEHVSDYRAALNFKGQDENGFATFMVNNGHLFCNGGFDGVTVGTMPGDTSGELYMITAYGVYGTDNFIDRYDKDYNILQFYKLSDFWDSESHMPLSNGNMKNFDKESSLVPDYNIMQDALTATDTLYVWTGNTEYGVQNLEYEWDTGDIVLYTYSNTRGFGENMYVIDGSKAPEMKELQVGQNNTDFYDRVRVSAVETSKCYKDLDRFKKCEFTTEGYPIVKHAVLKCICGDPSSHQYEEDECWGETGVLKNEYPICSANAAGSSDCGIHWLDNDGEDVDYFYLIDSTYTPSLYRRTINDNGSFTWEKMTAATAQIAVQNTAVDANLTGNYEQSLTNASGEVKISYTKSEADSLIQEKKSPDAPSGKVFAGWYQDAQYSNTYTGRESADTIYAKFADEQVLSVKFQITKGTKETSEETNLRLITTVDSLKYQLVGFEVTIKNKTQELTSNTVYTTLNGYLDEKQTVYHPTVFSTESAYFMAHTLTSIPNSFFAEGITVTPKWKTMDGTEVKGITRSFTISQIIASDYEELGWLTFEDSSDQMLITKNPERPVHQRISYSDKENYQDVTVTQLQNGGDYAFRVNGTGKVSPGGTMWSKTTYKAGSMLNFMLYVQVAEEAVQGKAVKVKINVSGSETEYAVGLSSDKFNRWIEVNAVLEADTSMIDFVVDFDDGSGQSYLGETPVMIYMDNVRVYQQKQVVKNADGSVTLLNPYNVDTLTYYIGHSASAGSLISFDVEFSEGAKAAVWSLGDGQWGDYEFSATDNITGKRTITATVKKDVSDIMIQLYYKNSDVTDKTGYTATISNVQVLDSDYYSGDGLTFEENSHMLLISQEFQKCDLTRVSYKEANITAQEGMGQYALKVKNSAENSQTKYPGFYMDLDQTYPTGTKLNAMLYVAYDGELAETDTVDFYGYTQTDSGAKWNQTIFSSKKFNQWIEVTLVLKQDTSKLKCYGQFESNVSSPFDPSKVTLYLDNIRVAYELGDDLTFEEAVHMEMISQEWQTFDLTRVSYEDENITAQNDMGQYALKVRYGTETKNQRYPGFYMDLDKSYPAGTMVGAMIYVAYDNTDNTLKDTDKVELQGNTEPTTNGAWNKPILSSTRFNEWIEATLVLQRDTSKIKFYIQLTTENGNVSSEFDPSKVTVYVDNLRIAYEQGDDLTFEDCVHMNMISKDYQQCELTRISYEDAGIQGLEDMGQYGLQIKNNSTNSTNKYPGCYIDLGKTYSAGTKFSIMLYAEYEGLPGLNKVDAYVNTYLPAKAGNSRTLSRTYFNRWIELTVTLEQDTSSIDLYAQFESNVDSNFECDKVTLYMDNLRVVSE